jgi:23S rRNA pseudouridine2605 synthase
MTLTEGKNREIRRVWSQVGFSTLALIRVAFGPFELGDLTPGGLQEVAKKDVEALRRKASTWPDEQGKVHSGVARKG